MDQLDALLAEAAFRCECVVLSTIKNSWVPLAHRSHCDKIYVVTGGRGTARLGDATYKIVPGEVYIFAAGTIQQGDTDRDDPLQKIWVHFEVSTTETLQLLRLFPPPQCLKGATAERIRALSEELLAEWYGKGYARQLAVKSLIMRILLEAYRAPASDHRKPDGRVRRKKGPPEAAENTSTRLPVDRIRQVLAMLTRRYPESLSLQDLADCAYLHPTYFTQVFKRLVGMPPMKYLEQIRLRRAQELLARTQRPIAQVAEQVGYGDPYYFSRAFRRLSGLAPTAFREQAQKATGELRE
ncbi:MAG: AraC family transcriptional regulator [Planctomycetota bacterium]|nr:AraC family transcriptional regulator [Planctomycetota bacterium]